MRLLLTLLVFTTLASAQIDPIVYIPDESFKFRLLQKPYWAGDGSNERIASSGERDAYGNLIYTKIDANNDGEIQESEAKAIKFLFLSGPSTYRSMYPYMFTNMTGISSFTNLEYLDCSNNKISSLDLSNLVFLKVLFCDYLYYGSSGPGIGELSSLNIRGLTNLETLNVNGNRLRGLDLSSSTSLTKLSCGANEINNLDVSKLNNLTHLDFSGDVSGRTQNINFSMLTNLTSLNCSYNQLTNLDVSMLTNLTYLNCSRNQLSSLDVSMLTNLSDLQCDNNQLTSLFIKNNNSSWTKLYFNYNPNLEYICVNEKDLEFVNSEITRFGYTNCVVNSYCSDLPGGGGYTILGNTILDSNSDGCDTNDQAFTNLKFGITDGSISGTLISNASGSFSIPVSSGTHTITPQLENPEYFTASPTSVNVTFPTQTSSITQNFCILPNGVKNDLEVVLIPISNARPGFDATYKIKYKNKGNTIQSGSITLKFGDAVLDLVASNPVATTEPNLLSWSFTDLKPFESGEINLTFNLNTPVETPALNGNDILSFIIDIIGETDETPEDNTFTLNHRVVNSFDPNDKTCLQGENITPEKVGQYVHYKIRFENTGTANAENVVVKDIIDTTKFDINTLTVTDGSHEFITRISDTNTVEFVFENINLPFDDANNDGYLVFKIKTQPTLVLGDTFKNKA